MREYGFQKDVATGNLTLPVAIAICLTLWTIRMNEWSGLASLSIVLLIGYLMIETNTMFTLIRTRTTLPVSLYWIWMGALTFLHPFGWENLIPLLFLVATMQLFRCYDAPNPAIPAFNTFLCIGTGCLLCPSMVCLAPLFLIGLIPFRATTLKSLTGSLLGFFTPYWLYFGYCVVYDELPKFMESVQSLITFLPISYEHLQPNILTSWIAVTLFLLICGFYSHQAPLNDKTRTRLSHSFLWYAGIWSAACALLQPQNLCIQLSIECICAGFLGGHLFTLTRNRFTSIFLFVTLVAILFITVLNLWIL